MFPPQMPKIIMMLGCLALINSIFSSSSFSAPLQVVLVGEESAKRVLVPREDVDDAWRTDPNFDDSNWLECIGKPGGIGFDRAGDYAPYISLDLGGEMAGRTTCYIRAKFDLSESDLRELDNLVLYVRYDDGFVAYLNGERVTAANAPTNLHRRAAASQTHEAGGFEPFDLRAALGLLRSGTNLLAVHGLNVSGDSPDFLVHFKLIARKNYRNNFVSDLPILVLESRSVPSNEKDVAVKVIDRGAGNRLTSPARLSTAGRLIKAALPLAAEKADYRLLLDADAELLGLPAGNDWTLLAPYSDKSLMRPALAAHIVALFGRPASHSRLCHLFLDEDYRGIYVVLESRTVHPNRLPLAALTPQDDSGDALTGGYLLRLNGASAGFDSPFPPLHVSARRVHYAFESPLPEMITAPQQNYIRGWIESWEKAAGQADDPAFFDSLDLPSVVDYFLLSEVCRDVSAYRSQTLLYKDRDSRGGRLKVEWQIDARHAFGNTTLWEGDRVEGLHLDYLLQHPPAANDSLPTPFWWKRLRNDPQFQAAAARRWRQLRADGLSEEALFAAADSLYRLLAAEQVLNFERWMILDTPIPPSAAAYASYDEAFDDLLIWLLDRIDALDERMAVFSAGLGDREVDLPDTRVLINSYPNPFNSSVQIQFKLVSETELSMILYDAAGRRVKNIAQSRMPAGDHVVQWDGCDETGAAMPSGVYLIFLREGKNFLTQKVALLR
ncbi:MAG: CotH kinase family protein [candidate division KSB1 bacterium]|nr:CotH kinase family protein [candidate division KSB1 bacterium]